MERLSGGNTCVHRLHPAAKLLTTAVFLFAVVSFDRYALSRLIPYVFFPTLMAALSETPYALLFKRFCVALPFCLFAGITNLLFDRMAAFAIGDVVVSYGAISFCVILFKTYLCVMAVLTLVATTPLADLTQTMRRWRFPQIFIVIFEMTYRYIGVLFNEAYTMHIAYSLRSAGAKALQMRDMGSFVGQLLLRSFDRAERVYSAMKCRGYALHSFPQGGAGWARKDICFCAIVCALCATLRFVRLW